MKYSNLPENTLIIGGWSSSCNACGHETLPEGDKHIEISGYGGPTPTNCNVKWDYVYSSYADDEVVQMMRPDLKLIPNTGPSS